MMNIVLLKMFMFSIQLITCHPNRLFCSGLDSLLNSKTINPKKSPSEYPKILDHGFVNRTEQVWGLNCDKEVVDPTPAIIVEIRREPKHITHVQIEASAGLFLYRTVKIRPTKKNWNSVETNQSQGSQESCPITLLNGYMLLIKITWVHKYLLQVAVISSVITPHSGPEENNGNTADTPIIIITGKSIFIMKWKICRI